MGEVTTRNPISTDTRLCAQCRQLYLSMGGRNLSAERNALAQRAASVGRYTPMTDVGVRVAGLGNLSRIAGVTDCLLCRLLVDQQEQYRGFSCSLDSIRAERSSFFYAFSAQHCFHVTGMGLDHNFLVVHPDLDDDETYGMEPVILNGQVIHGINHKLHPDFTRCNNRYIICQRAFSPFDPTGLQPRAISEKVDISIVKQWLQDCQASHGQCKIERKQEAVCHYPPDMKLIDCLKRLVMDAKDIEQGDPPSYVALSYVWGGAFHPPTKLDAGLPDALPQVIEDAISVTLATGYRYLWVDQYCIDQDNTPHKIQQIKIMDQIYSSAAWTIIDGAGGDANHGLIGISRPRSQDLAPIGMRNGIEIFRWPSHSDQILNESKWATRAWTYQEAFFSRRIAMFTSTGLYFECQETYENEGLVRNGDLSVADGRFANSMDDDRASAGRLFPRYDYGPLTRSMEPSLAVVGDDSADSGKTLRDFWRRVEEYTCREMTFPEDSLAAFRGVLQFYVRRGPACHEGMGLTSVCGIPFLHPAPTLQPPIPGELSLGLCWSHAHGSTSRRRPSFPSWSWAGWMGQVHGGSDERVESLVRDISFETVDGDGSNIREPWYDMEGRESEVLVFEGNVLPPDALSISANGRWDVLGLGSHARFDLDEHVSHGVILHGLRERTYVIVPVVLLHGIRTHNEPYCSARMLLLRRNFDAFERVGVFIFGSSFISFKLINLIEEGRSSWDRETLRII